MTHFTATALSWVLGALAEYGYRIVFAATLLENLFIVGSFTPGDVITAGAAVVATTPEGARLSPWLLILVGATGSMIGANISYFIGRRGGRDLIERMGPRFGIDRTAIEATEEYFEHHGPRTILLARFIAVFKNVAPAVAGTMRMNLALFELYSLIGSIGYVSVLVAVGWFLGANFRVGLKYFGALSWVGFAVVVAVGAFLWFAKRRRDARLLAENAAEFEADAEADEADAEADTSQADVGDDESQADAGAGAAETSER